MRTVISIMLVPLLLMPSMTSAQEQTPTGRVVFTQTAIAAAVTASVSSSGRLASTSSQNQPQSRWKDRHPDLYFFLMSSTIAAGAGAAIGALADRSGGRSQTANTLIGAGAGAGTGAFVWFMCTSGFAYCH